MFILKQQHKQGYHFVKYANFDSKNVHPPKCMELYWQQQIKITATGHNQFIETKASNYESNFLKPPGNQDFGI